ncbi:TonB-dependent receptor [Paracoccus jiaweipingae]|uniref:TonB-dependent receptor n=1 Tax=unclassified Paracoccus (in: a-proteobacteria) TaxID=2688777 RepID=UPI0037A11688
MRKGTFSRLLCSCASGVILCGMAVPALAQDAPKTGRAVVLEEIVLIGEKVARSLARTASSVTVLDSRDAAAAPGDASVASALQGVPNLIFTDSVGAPMIRGQDSQGPNSGAGAFFSGTVPRASINVDGRYLSYNEYAFGAASVWDVAGIEVYRGPQTAAQGANSIAGAIFVRTNDPSFTPEGQAHLQYGSGGRRRAALAYSAPVAPDLAARIALDYSARDTFIDYVSDNFAKGKSDQDFESRMARVKLLWQPADLTGFEAKLTLEHDQTNRPSTESAFAPFEDLNSLALTMPSWKQRSNAAVLDVSQDFDNGLRLINQLQYADTNSRRVIEPFQGGSANIDLRSVSNETRLTFGDAGGAGLSGVVGLFVARRDTDETLWLRGVSSFDDQKDSLGLYTEVTWRGESPWSVTGGLRYQRDRVQRRGNSSFAARPLDYDETFDAVLPRVSVSYDLSDRTTIGGLVSKGYNPGGISLNLRSGEYVPFKAETVWNYELFGRTELMGDRLILTGNLFYSDFKNAQRYVQVSLPENIGQSLTVNAEEATSYGLELGMDYQATDSLRLRGGLGLLHTEIGKFTSAIADFTGKEFARAPRYTASLAADWDITAQWRLSGDVRLTDGYYSDDANTEEFKIGSYAIANARVTYTAQNGVEMFGYVNNIFDVREPLHKQVNRSVKAVEAAMTQPREVGIGLIHRF